MKVNLNINEDEQFRQYVRDLIGGEVRRTVREHANEMVAAEIAKLRLLQPNSPAFSELVAKHMDSAIKTAIAKETTNLPHRMRQELVDLVAEVSADVRKNMKELLIQALRTRL